MTIEVPARIVNAQFLERLASAHDEQYGFFSDADGAVTAGSGLTVAVAVIPANACVIDGTVETTHVAATQQTMSAADATNPRRDLVYVDQAGAIGTVTGTPAASPVLPTLAADRLALAEVYVAASATVLAASDIEDLRQPLSRRTVFVRKASDETVNNSVTLQNDDALLFAIAPSETWIADFFLRVTSGSGTSSFKAAITVPTGATLLLLGDHMEGTQGAGDPTTTSGGAIAITSSALAAALHFHAIVVNGTTAGSVTLQWAQVTAEAFDTTVKLNSHLFARKVA